MELNKGLKQTEVGAIPTDWDLIEVDKISSSVASGRSKQDSRFGDFPLYGSTGVIGSVTRGEYSGDAILVARVGANAGRLNVVSGSYGVTDNTIIVKINSNFPLQYIWRQLEAKKLNRMVFGSGQPLITGTQIKAIKIPVPATRDEQEAIANALMDADTYIESLEKLIAKKRLVKKSLLQELFTPTKNWKTFRLGDCATLKARIGWQGLTTAEYLDSGDYGLVTGTDFKDGKIDWDNCHYVTKDRYEQDRNIQLKENDILVTKDGTIGKIALISSIPQPTTLNSGVFVVRPINNAFNPRCFYYFLSSIYFDEFLAQLAAGSTISHLYQKDFVHFKFKLPNPDQQKEIGSVLLDVDIDIELYEKKLKKARLLKQGMMQELLTGRIRLV